MHTMDPLHPQSDSRSAGATPAAHDTKRTLLIYSPDLSFCFSLSMLFQDRYTVVTTTNPGMLETFAEQHSADLAIIDAVPSESMNERLAALRKRNSPLPVIMLYVYHARDAVLETVLRRQVDVVIYKPFDIADLARRVAELLPR
jgi:DNA-binding response OmpR family regulator